MRNRETLYAQVACVVVTAWLVAGCVEFDVSGIKAPDSYRIRGIAVGLDAPLALELRYTGGSEILSITGGSFEFATALPNGGSYAVTFVEQSSCLVDGATGVVRGADAEMLLHCGGIMSLASLAISGPTASELEVAAERLQYEASVPLLQESTAVTAVTVSAAVTLEIAGISVESGTPSPEIALALADNPIDVVVRHPIGASRTYQIIVNRAGEIAQYVYGKASNTGSDDYFGWSVAVWGDTLAVGAYREDSAATGVGGNQTDNSATDSGAVYVFRRSGSNWQQEAYFKASNTGDHDEFGRSVALWGDTLAVGAYREDSAATGVDGNQADDSASNSGAAYVFRRSATNWQQEAYLKASNTDAGDQFGYRVALWEDMLAVGAIGEDSAATRVNDGQEDDSASNSGAVYVFRWSSGTWQQEAYVKPSNTEPGDNLGSSVALWQDTLAVGAIGEDSMATGEGGSQTDNSASSSGAVYVFRHSGSAWQQEAYLKASNTETSDYFGGSVALWQDTLAVGATGEASATRGVNGDEADNSAAYSGAVYVFRHSGSAWQQEAYLKASNTETLDYFGSSVALWQDTLAVGATGEASAATGINGNQANNSDDDSGAVYVFLRNGTHWQQEAYVKASDTDGRDYFGSSVALWQDTLAVGATGEASATRGVNGDEADNSARDSGAIYIFH